MLDVFSEEMLRLQLQALVEERDKIRQSAIKFLRNPIQDNAIALSGLCGIRCIELGLVSIGKNRQN